ncbi:hypothetical protein BHM03_00062584, partial [Ensete ventricosum]
KPWRTSLLPLHQHTSVLPLLPLSSVSTSTQPCRCYHLPLPPLRNRRCPLHCRRSYLSAPVASNHCHPSLDAASSVSTAATSCGFLLHQQPHHLAVTPVATTSVNRCHHQCPPFSVGTVIYRPRCLIPLMPLLSSAPVAQAVVAAAVLFLYQPRCCLPPLCRQSCEQDRPDRASPTSSPPLHRCTAAIGVPHLSA